MSDFFFAPGSTVGRWSLSSPAALAASSRSCPPCGLMVFSFFGADRFALARDCARSARASGLFVMVRHARGSSGLGDIVGAAVWVGRIPAVFVGSTAWWSRADRC